MENSHPLTLNSKGEKEFNERSPAFPLGPSMPLSDVNEDENGTCSAVE